MIDETSLGKMMAAVENNSKTNEEIKEMLKEIKSDHNSLANEVREIRKELDMYAFFIRMLKFGGGLMILLLTLKFGDIPKLWNSLFG